MVLFIIGIGLADAKDISVKGLDAVKSCTKIYLESYTSKLQCANSELENLYGKPVIPVFRDFVEDGSTLLAEAKSNNVALLVIGDSLSATTHWELIQRAKSEGIEIKIIHNASIYTGIASAGLQLYKFGKVTSIPFPMENTVIETPYNIIKENSSIGAHSLVLLDLRPELNKFMSVNDAIKFLLDSEARRKESVFTENTLCIGVARVGSSSELIIAGSAKELLNVDFGSPVHCLVIPGRMHFLEEEAVVLFKK